MAHADERVPVVLWHAALQQLLRGTCMMCQSEDVF